MREFEKDRSHFPVDLNEMAQSSATKDDVILRIEEGRRLEALEALELEAQRRNRLARMIAVVFVAILFGVIALFIYRSVSNHPQLAVLPPEKPAAGITVTEKTTETGENYVLTKATITSSEGQIGLHTYDFYSNRFLKNQDVLSDPDLLRDVLRGFQTDDELRERSGRSWVLIFAGASEEGSENHNLVLTCERVRTIAKMMAVDVGLSTRGYWGIRAGEFKGLQPGDTSRTDDQQESVLSSLSAPQKENKLSPQRRLLVAIITPQYAVPKENEDRTITWLSDEFYNKSLLPDGYQYSAEPLRTKPVAIDLNKLKQLTSDCSPKPKGNRLSH